MSTVFDTFLNFEIYAGILFCLTYDSKNLHKKSSQDSSLKFLNKLLGLLTVRHQAKVSCQFQPVV